MNSFRGTVAFQGWCDCLHGHNFNDRLLGVDSDRPLRYVVALNEGANVSLRKAKRKKLLLHDEGNQVIKARDLVLL